MFDYTQCDAVMIARAAQGNPWIFRQARNLFLGSNHLSQPSLTEIAKMCNTHFNLLIEDRGSTTGMNLMRKHLSNYLKGFPGAAQLRQKLVTATSFEKMKNELKSFEKFACENL